MKTKQQTFQIDNIRFVDPANNEDKIGSLRLVDGYILDEIPSDGQSIDATGLTLLPGLIDVHVHFRDPGGSEAEDSLSGAKAAARGGFTHVVTMPNTTPPCDSPAAVRRQIAMDLPVKILPSACITAKREGKELADLARLADAGTVAFTDDGNMVANDDLMRQAMVQAAKLNIPIMQHAMDPILMGKGIIYDSPLARRLGLPTVPPETEVVAVRRDISLAAETGCAAHMQHLSCSGSVQAIRSARQRGVPVTGEVSPHHLAFCAEDIIEDDGNLRMNPPLGNRNDRHALIEGVLDGTIAILATDHAPHAPDTKNKGFAKAPFGVIGLENALSSSWQVLGIENGMNLNDFVACWTTAPAALVSLPTPTLSKSDRPASFTIVDFNASWTVEPNDFASKSRNCPFAGQRLPARILMTVCEGRITWLDPTWTGAAKLRPLVFSYRTA